MVERRGRASLVQEPRAGAFVLHHVAGEDLQGHVAPQAGIVSAVHHAHAAGSQPADDAVVREGLFEKFVHEDQATSGGVMEKL